MTFQKCRQTSIGLFVIHNLWLGTVGLRNIYYDRWPQKGEAIDLVFLAVWILLFNLSLTPWLFWDTTWGRRGLLLAVSFGLYFAISLVISSFITAAYMASIL
jgi:hypothetical protein